MAAANTWCPASSSRAPSRNFGAETLTAATIEPLRAAHRRGHGHETDFELLAGDCHPAATLGGYPFVELVHGAGGVGCTRSQVTASEAVIEFLKGMVEQQRPATRCARGGGAPALPAARSDDAAGISESSVSTSMSSSTER